MLNAPTTTARCLASLGLMTIGLVATVPAVAQQRLSLADLQAQITALQARVGSQQTQIATLQSQLAATNNNPLLALDGVLSYDAATQTVRFTGVDVQIVNGAPVNVINGRGNLIVGYNSPRLANPALCSIGYHVDKLPCEADGGVWATDHKSGSHNLVVGEGNGYSSYGGVVFGTENVIAGPGATVTAGRGNMALGVGSSVSGGDLNRAYGTHSSIGGGRESWAVGENSSVSGGGSLNAYYRLQWRAGNLSELY